MISILIADDHTIMREGLKQILAECADMHVAGEACNGAEALVLVRQKKFDVVVLDMSMPGKSGIELIKQLKSEQPHLPILILSMHKEEQYAVRSMKAGAAGYLCKDSASQQLVQALRKVAGGGVFISPAASESIAAELSTGHAALPHTQLSDREFQIFLRLAVGEGLTKIADTLNLSVKTVSTHKTRLLQKMQFTNTSELTRYAMQHNLINNESNAAD